MKYCNKQVVYPLENCTIAHAKFLQNSTNLCKKQFFTFELQISKFALQNFSFLKQINYFHEIFYKFVVENAAKFKSWKAKKTFFPLQNLIICCAKFGKWWGNFPGGVLYVFIVQGAVSVCLHTTESISICCMYCTTKSTWCITVTTASTCYNCAYYRNTGICFTYSHFYCY